MGNIRPKHNDYRIGTLQIPDSEHSGPHFSSSLLPGRGAPDCLSTSSRQPMQGLGELFEGESADT